MDLCIFPKSANMTHSQSAISNLAFGNYSWTWSVSKQHSVPQQHSAIPAKSATIKVSEQHFVPQQHSVDQQHSAIPSKAGEPSLSSFQRAISVFIPASRQDIPTQYHSSTVSSHRRSDSKGAWCWMTVHVHGCCLWYLFGNVMIILGHGLFFGIFVWIFVWHLGCFLGDLAVVWKTWLLERFDCWDVYILGC